ncbi:hypothetical protein RhiirA5_381738 [Rhizophagus irregularis]|uniref:DUF659 domain-containing protein n=1 Tax=Rhizophagus irregularis TaxID=588596 RepID=A0A2N0P3L6_9GLOM|nr:hypothetical protein RhiirA5_381738 [Rhizophagus irregularis]
MVIVDVFAKHVIGKKLWEKHMKWVSVEVKQIFLEKIRKRSSLKLDHLLPSNNDETATKKAKIIQKKITSIFESDKIEKSKIIRCNRALTRLFVCCGIPFSVMSNPFFVDFVKCLCPAYELPNRVTFAGPWVDQELTNVLEIILSETRSTKNITLGLDGWSYKAGALLSENIKDNLIEGGGLKGYCKTRWSTAFDCLMSILRCERSLHNILEIQPDTLSSESIELLINNISGGKNLANKLVGQMANYKDFKVPSEFEYIPRTFSIESWWKMIKQHDNWIREIALIINSITPEQGR